MVNPDAESSKEQFNVTVSLAAKKLFAEVLRSTDPNQTIFETRIGLNNCDSLRLEITPPGLFDEKFICTISLISDDKKHQPETKQKLFDMNPGELSIRRFYFSQFDIEDSTIAITSASETRIGSEGLGLAGALINLSHQIAQAMMQKYPNFFAGQTVYAAIYDSATKLADPNEKLTGWSGREAIKLGFQQMRSKNYVYRYYYQRISGSMNKRLLKSLL